MGCSGCWNGVCGIKWEVHKIVGIHIVAGIHLYGYGHTHGSGHTYGGQSAYTWSWAGLHHTCEEKSISPYTFTHFALHLSYTYNVI